MWSGTDVEYLKKALELGFTSVMYDGSMYTDPAAAEEFSNISGIDELACAFGTAHGLYTKTPKLDFERLSKMDSRTNVPIVRQKLMPDGLYSNDLGHKIVADRIYSFLKSL